LVRAPASLELAIDYRPVLGAVSLAANAEGSPPVAAITTIVVVCMIGSFES
jgi:hypothetical protein